MQRWLRVGLILVVAALLAPNDVQGRRRSALCTVMSYSYFHQVYPGSREYQPNNSYAVYPSFSNTYTESAVECLQAGISHMTQSQLADVCEANTELNSLSQFFSEMTMVWNGQVIGEPYANPITTEGSCCDNFSMYCDI
jgi:hypothetical protein